MASPNVLSTCDCKLASHHHNKQILSLFIVSSVCHCLPFKINCGAAISQAQQLQLIEYDFKKMSQGLTFLVVNPIKNECEEVRNWRHNFLTAPCM